MEEKNSSSFRLLMLQVFDAESGLFQNHHREYNPRLGGRYMQPDPTALVPTGATYYVYDEAGKLLGEYDANGTPLYETIYLGSPVGVLVQTGTAGAGNIATSLYNVSTDQLGAPRVITRQSDEAIVWRWDSAEAFGGTAPNQNPSGLGTFTFNQRLPGQVFDAESGLFQNWNREYNPRVGRYMQSDPIGLEGGINTFSYVEGNPLSKTDPQGLVATSPVPAPAPSMSFAPWAPESQQDICVASNDYSKRKAYCLAFCQYELAMPGRFDNFGPHRACMRRCMGSGGFTM